MSTLTVGEKLKLQNLKDLIDSDEINEGIPRMQAVKLDDGTYEARLKGFHSQKGDTIIDALAAMHDYLLRYYQHLNRPDIAMGPLSKAQLEAIESYLSIRSCTCGLADDEDYCFCRGFRRT